MVIDNQTGDWTYTPTATARHNAAGTGPTTDTFTVTVDDGHGGTDQVNVIVNITPANNAPAVVDSGTRT